MPGHFVYMWRAHINTTSILSYSFSHSVELPLCFTSLMWNSNFYTEQFRFSTDDISVDQCKSSACTLLLSFLMFQTFVLFFHLLLSKAAYVLYMTVSTLQTHAFFTLSPKVWSTTFSKSFQYLKITLLLHGSFHERSHSTCMQVWLASQPMKETVIIEVYTAEYRT